MINTKLVWFRNDLRIRDNQALYSACERAAQMATSNAAGSGVVAVVAITPEQWVLQDESKSRVQFWLANVNALKAALAGLNIPLKIIHTANNETLPQQLLT